MGAAGRGGRPLTPSSGRPAHSWQKKKTERRVANATLFPQGKGREGERLDDGALRPDRLRSCVMIPCYDFFT